MRNLLGRLNARDPDELGRIAAAWQVVVSGGDKLGQVAQLYQAMTDIRAGRDAWARLPEDERALVALLALAPAETGRPLSDLARELDKPEPEVRATAVRLYHRGILAREGDDDPLPVGEAPRLFMPRELAALFRRVLDEIEAGDIAATPLRTLLALLDDREVEEAAEAWGIRVIPGIRTRAEITQALLGQVGHPERLAAVERRLKRDAARIWERIRAAGPTEAVPLGEAHIAAALSPDSVREAQRLRQALAQLEETLLVWHTYRPDGSRWLFSPPDVRAPASASAGVAALPDRVEGAGVEAPARHPHPVAWDLLTLLRALAPPRDRPIDDVAEAPRPWLRRLNDGLWNRGRELPPPGYLEFLIDLARVEGVLTGGDPAIHEPFQVSASVRQWRNRSFAEQTSRLRATWLSSSSWIEGDPGGDVDVEGADWAGLRLKLLTHLGALEQGAWYRVDDVAAWLAGRDPDMLGAHFTVATARNVDVPGDPAATRRAAVAEVARATLETGFVWFGLVEIARPAAGARLLRATPALAGAEQPEPAALPGGGGTGPAITVGPEGGILLREPSPLRVWSVSAFADLVELGAESRYRLSETSISRALRAGFDPRDIEGFLVNQSGQPLPSELQARVRDWSQQVRRVRVTRTLLLTPDDAGELTALTAALGAAGLEATPVNDGLLVTLPGPVETTPAELALLSRLRDAGFTPHGLPIGRPPAKSERG